MSNQIEAQYIYQSILVTSLELSFKNATKHVILHKSRHPHVDGLVQNCSNPITNALETLQAWTRPSIFFISLNSDILVEDSAL